MYSEMKREVIHTAQEMKRSALVSLAGGNVSARTEDGHILVTPSGTYYETMTEMDVLVMEADGKQVEGTLKPSVDMEALLYIYRALPQVNAVIHTHQPYATAVGLISDTLPACVTTLPNATLGEVKVAPYTGAATLEMGIEAVKNLGGKRAVILKNHGVLTVGETLKEALYAAVYMEDAARTYLAACAARNGSIAALTENQIAEAVEAFKKCGQK